MENAMTCLLVEDEPLAATILEDFIGQLSWLRYIGRCANAMEAAEVLHTQSVQVLFLDIHLPGIKGLDFLRSLQAPPQTIITTAYENYAVEGFDLNVVDYLLKPIAFPRFFQAVQKLQRLPVAKERPFHFFNSNKKMVRVWFDEIAWVESLREYVKIRLVNGQSVVTKMPLSTLEKMLEGQGLLRIHRSFLVATRHIEAYTAIEVMVQGESLPVGRLYRDQAFFESE